MTLREKTDRLMVALYQAMRSGNASDYPRLNEVADSIGLERGPGELRMIAQSLRDRGLVDASFTLGGGDEGGLSVRLTSDGYASAEAAAQAYPDYLTDKSISLSERPHAAKRLLLLVALYQRAKIEGLQGYYELQEVADQGGVERNEGELRLLASWLRDHGALDLSLTMGGGDEGGMDARILGRGAEMAEEYLEANPPAPEAGLVPPGGSLVPAAGRYVTLHDNQRAEVLAALTLIAEGVRQTNDVSDEDRLIATSEIAAFEATMVLPRVPTELIERFATTVLTWIAATFAATVVTETIIGLGQNLLSMIAG